jgi:DNA modification methylase
MFNDTMTIEMRGLDEIRPYEQNPRNNDSAVEAVARSIREYGFRQPIVVDGDGVVIAGHTRLQAAKHLGLEQVPVHVANLTPEQAKAYRLADNRTAMIAEWNDELLAIELGELKALDIDLAGLGFSDVEISKLLEPGLEVGATDPDDVPAPPDEAITQPGDIWILGNHRLMCGDSGSVEDVDRLLDGAVIHLCNTDPPYNVKVEPRSNNAIAAGLSSFQSAQPKGRKGSGGGSGQGEQTHHQKFDVERHPEKAKGTTKQMRARDRPLANDFVTDEAFDLLLDAWFGNIARVLMPGGSFYIWGGYANLGNYPPFLKKHGLYFSQGIVWDKLHPVLTRKDFMGAFELAFYGWKEGAAHRYFGPNNETDLWHVKKVPPQQMCHITEKSVELARRAIEYSSQPGENILDLFGGSGSTLIAAEQTGRKAFLMELDAPYCDVILARWAAFTSKDPVLQRTGETFSALKAAQGGGKA